MSCGIIINSIGLIFDIIGAGIIFFKFPSIFEIDGKGVIQARESDIYDKNKKVSKYGLLLLIIGFILQLISNFVE